MEVTDEEEFLKELSPIEGADWVPNPLSRSPSQASSRSGLQASPLRGPSRVVNPALMGGLREEDVALSSPGRYSSRMSSPVQRLQTPEGCDWRPPPEILVQVIGDSPVATPPVPTVLTTLPFSRPGSCSVAVQTPAEISDWGLPTPEGCDWRPLQEQEVELTKSKLVEERFEVLLPDEVRRPLDEGAAAAPETAPEQDTEAFCIPPLEFTQAGTPPPECTPEQATTSCPSFVPAENHGPAPILSPELGSVGVDSRAESQSIAAVMSAATPVRAGTPAAKRQPSKMDAKLGSKEIDAVEESQNGQSPPASRAHNTSLPFAASPSSSAPQRKQTQAGSAKKGGNQEQSARRPQHYMFAPSHRGSALGPRVSCRGGSQNHMPWRTAAGPRTTYGLPFGQSARPSVCVSPSGPHRSPPLSSRNHHTARTGRSPEAPMSARVPARSPPRMRSPLRGIVSAPGVPPFCATSPRLALTSNVQRSPSIDTRIGRSASITPHSPGPCDRRTLYPAMGESPVLRQNTQHDSLTRPRAFTSPTRSVSATPIGSFVAPPMVGSFVAPPPMQKGSFVAPPPAGSYVASPMGSFVASPLPMPMLSHRYTAPDPSANATAAALKRSFVSPPFHHAGSHSPTRWVQSSSPPHSSSRVQAAARATSPSGQFRRVKAGERGGTETDAVISL